MDQDFAYPNGVTNFQRRRFGRRGIAELKLLHNVAFLLGSSIA